MPGKPKTTPEPDLPSDHNVAQTSYPATQPSKHGLLEMTSHSNTQPRPYEEVGIPRAKDINISCSYPLQGALPRFGDHQATRNPPHFPGAAVRSLMYSLQSLRQRGSDAKEATTGAQIPSSSRHKRPFRQGKAPGTKTRASRRLAGRPPEFGGA